LIISVSVWFQRKRQMKLIGHQLLLIYPRFPVSENREVVRRPILYHKRIGFQAAQCFFFSLSGRAANRKQCKRSEYGNV